jgi:hypothetical protein
MVANDGEHFCSVMQPVTTVRVSALAVAEPVGFSQGFDGGSDGSRGGGVGKAGRARVNMEVAFQLLVSFLNRNGYGRIGMIALPAGPA